MNVIKKFEPLFGDWYAESFIGAGSFGRVYKIYREELGHRLYSALKYISIPAEEGEIRQLRLDGMDDESISTYYDNLAQNIHSEINLMNRLKGNTNVISFEDSRIIPKPDGVGYDIFIRMELLESLTNRIVSNSLPVEETVKLGMDVCNALTLCAKNQIIHRDIKPDNIFISPNGDYKLGDFGVARQLEKTASFMSKKGPYTYMAPEVYKGEEYGATCDIYSLGLVMYRLLNNGRLPFLPPAPAPISPEDRELAIIRRMKGEAFEAPCAADPELSRIVLKACAFDPKNRYGSAAEMKRDLENLLASKAKHPSEMNEEPAAVPDHADTPEQVGGTDRSIVQTDTLSNDLVLCPNCGSRQQPGRKFCGNCGKPMAASIKEETSKTPVPGHAENTKPKDQQEKTQPKKKKKRVILWIVAAIVSALLMIGIAGALILGCIYGCSCFYSYPD